MVQPKSRRLVTEAALGLLIDSPVANVAALPVANAGNRGVIRFVLAENEPYYSNGTAWSSIAQGAQGNPGPAGTGVPAGGSALQYIRKNSAGSTTEWATLDKATVGLGNADNTSDANKPVSTAQATALTGKADLSGGKVVESQIPDRLSATALSAATVGRGMPTADDGHEYVWLAGVIRNEGLGAGWQLLPEGTNHRPIGITSIETVDDPTGPYGYIRVNYPGVVGASGMTVTFIAVPDETLARHGFSCGTSVTQEHADIRISQSAAAASDYVSYNGTSWVSQDGKLTPTFSAGVLTLTHEAVPASAQYAISAVPRTEFYTFNAPRASGTLDTGKFSLEVRDKSIGVADYVSYNGTDWVSQDGKFTGLSFDTATGVLTMNHLAISSTATQRVNLSPRGTTRPVVTSTNTPTSTTMLKIQFVDPAGNVILTPNTNMRAYVSHGGGTGELVTTPNADMRVFASHGGGNRQWKPSALNTIVYPGSNIWLLGFMGRD